MIYTILKYPYVFALTLLKMTAQLFWGFEVWPRHSYLRNSFNPGKSDLDISIYTSKPKSTKSFIRFYKLFKMVFPFLGELYIYDDEIIFFIRKNSLNGFELMRDPLFLKKFSISVEGEKFFSKASAIVFITKALVNDWHNLCNLPEKRIKKWAEHFSDVSINLKKFSGLNISLPLNEQRLLPSIFSHITNLFETESESRSKLLRSRLRMLVNLILETQNDIHSNDWLTPLLNNPLEGALLNSLFIPSICNLRMSHIELEPQFERVLIAQIDWLTLNKVRTYKTNRQLSTLRRTLENLQFICQHHKKKEIYSPLQQKISEALRLIDRPNQ